MGARAFSEIFDHYLAEELGQPPRIFLDEQIEAGHVWPEELADALARSKVLVGLWTPLYFSSAWCQSELAHMYARERQCGLRSRGRRGSLIIPATLHDGEDFPTRAKKRQMVDLSAYASPWAVRDGPTTEALAQRIAAWVPTVAHAIQRAPAFDPTWQDLAFEDFMALFTRTNLEQTNLPGLG